MSIAVTAKLLRGLRARPLGRGWSSVGRLHTGATKEESSAKPDVAKRGILDQHGASPRRESLETQLPSTKQESVEKPFLVARGETRFPIESSQKQPTLAQSGGKESLLMKGRTPEKDFLRESNFLSGEPLSRGPFPGEPFEQQSAEMSDSPKRESVHAQGGPSPSQGRVPIRDPFPDPIPADHITGLGDVAAGDRIYVAMSGGVDSATTAAVLVRRFGPGRIHGVFMNNWSATSRCQESSWNDVRRVCGQLGMAARRVDLERDYWTEVFEPMLQAYQRGDTPNPDVGCNRHVKFGALLAALRRQDPGARWLATGHYAGLRRTPGGARLVARPAHRPKDQSYYLATVPPATLGAVLFPLAGLTKPEVRALARGAGLAVADKPDSQGLCFVEQQTDFGARGFRRFLAEYLTESPGPIVTADAPDRVVGQHRGLWTHTIGQRASVAMPQAAAASRGKWFVVAKDAARNALVIARGTDAPALFADRVTSRDFHWHRAPGPGPLHAQYRSLQEPWPVSAWRGAGAEVVLEFAAARRAVAPGQYLVVYEDDTVIGVGTIATADRVGT